ncbi:hypothetical protein BATDEDRAFT_85640 [Batrachochytrium dendrobatidis JAM81]|uniref:ATPase inhibitor, mitochondrial n=2 Tax=Batrachochytrium dendrobatidis TaxID=109871 RepID=F4NRA8_BATDJ|nr:uncharacterized protein BATDEDRAFT_85640 [Batrachochytrium dendrobatidis JAM81]EGF83721.1 hypothetical protein BATDEDRAFT_85640 [Batrachochytrium dendrobatidis JAM81]KAJ8331786.1 hypothetical protein O5D80_000674 [Batrachochytrium dendrobatidis]KAK5672232.1 hypothetical protein QVD99_002032 [Batrachochytrium dendrobatidis]OAJ35776.1 hypothetical protein BDEG_20016 [Batrachochytrium dendrobatidis JEL423]|eukprot:XP_006676204.1 hypothetical protein BATDEDRAFT_85640 [Batrachochytrium dendrobatidis JAM81]
MLSNKVIATAAFSLARRSAVYSVIPSASYSGNIREAGGGFSRRESAEEERYAHEQELISIRKLKADLAKREASIHTKLGLPVVEEPHQEVSPETFGSAGQHSSYAGGGSIGKRGAAAEERYIREHNAERVRILQEKNKK